jgi:HlyD family secretion protein
MRAFRNGCHHLPAALAAAATLGFLPAKLPADEPKPLDTNPFSSRAAAVTRGNPATTISATGTVEPEEIVDVSAAVTGRITSLAADPRSSSKSIDCGSPVEEGTLLAQIDDTLYATAVEQARAACTRAEGELAAAKAKLGLAKAEWQRTQGLSKSNSISASDLDEKKCAYEVAQASVTVAEATVAQSKVVLRETQINLASTRITSPVKGVVIDRRVNVGQTVVANVPAASLFLIAKDLKKIQVWVSVNEADITRIHAGQPVRFTVDAHPGTVFEGKVAQVRLNGTMSQNVVMYTVVVATDNAEGKLLPYLTAHVQFEVGPR